MTDAVWIAVSSVAGVLAMGISYVAYRERHAAGVSAGEAERIRQIVRAETEPARELALRLDGIIARQDQLAQEIRDLNIRTGAILDRLAVMETKIEVFWRSVAMDAAKIIHSPDPRRAHIDALLDSFMNGTMTPGEERELREVLTQIRDHEPGGPAVGFPVYPGEQIAAAILLRTMEHALQGG